MIGLSPETVLDTVQFDENGYMVDANQWLPAIAEAIAAREGLTLTRRHWLVINFARQNYEETGESPSLRRITRHSGVDTKEMYALFPNGPAKLAAKLAGLKKPTGCI